MKPVIALVGRPNVGKSTLFNRFTRSRNALVANFPGLTRDRHYGEGHIGGYPFLVIDTGGFEPITKTGIMYEMAKQTRQAVIESDIILFVVNIHEGLTLEDKIITDFLRKSNRYIILVINKAEGKKYNFAIVDFYELGFGKPCIISATHGNGVNDLAQKILTCVSKERFTNEIKNILSNTIKIAIVGRPNVGKSTLVNTLLGEERVITFNTPGTTRDSIEIPFKSNGKNYIIIDTAGIRRRGKIFEVIEKFSVVKTLQSISKSNVVLLLLDAQQNISDQDAHIARFIIESGRALVVGINKWDNLQSNYREEIKMNIKRKLNFLSFAKFHFISAIQSIGISLLIKSIDLAFSAANVKLTTPQLTRALIQAVEYQQPRRKNSIRPKLRYAHQGGKNPPVVVIHGNALENIDNDYKRYLEKYFRETFLLTGTPLRVEFHSSKNPFMHQN